MSSKQMVTEEIIRIVELNRNVLSNSDMWHLFEAYNLANKTDFNQGAMSCADCRREVFLYWANKVEKWKKEQQ
jgi:hypothetical protein